MKKLPIIPIVPIIGGLLLAAIVYLVFFSAAVIVPIDNTAVIIPAVDTIPGVPQVIFIGITAVSPLDLAEEQGLKNNIIVTFDEAMDVTTINENTFKVSGPNIVNPSDLNIKGTITSDTTGKIWTFNPTYPFGINSIYTVTITTGAKGVSGNSLIENFVWSFTTGGNTGGSGSPSSVTPVLTTITLMPRTASLIVGAEQQLTAAGLDQFNNTIAATIAYTSSNMTVATVNSTGSVTSLVVGTTTINASSGAVSNTTAITVIGTAGPATVELELAADFAILSKTLDSDIAPYSHIIGNVGASPIDGAAIGISCTAVRGTIYDVDDAYAGGWDSNTSCQLTNDTLLTLAVGDMEAAYTDAAGRTAGVGPYLNPGSGDLAGLTLTPGVYTRGGNQLITDDVYLDCQGNENGTFIFQVSGTLNIANGKHVVLSGECQEKNIFWAAADTVTLGTTSIFKGNILTIEPKAIVLQTGATLDGRALSQGAVTLDASTVTKPSP